MKASQPVGGACGGLGQEALECAASYRLCGGFVEAGGDPLSASPVVVRACQFAQVPAPFHGASGLWKYGDQTEWIDARKWQLCEAGFHEFRRIGSAHGWNDFTATDRIGGYSPRNGIPVDKGKGDA